MGKVGAFQDVVVTYSYYDMFLLIEDFGWDCLYFLKKCFYLINIMIMESIEEIK